MLLLFLEKKSTRMLQLLTGDNTGQSWGRSPSFGFYTPKLKKKNMIRIKELKPNKKTKEEERKG